MQKKQLSVLVLIILCFLLGCNRETPKDESQQNYEDESNISKTPGGRHHHPEPDGRHHPHRAAGYARLAQDLGGDILSSPGIVTYPLGGITYDAEDAAAYFSTRTSGVFSTEEDFAVTVAEDGGTAVTVGAGRAWMHVSRFTGQSVTLREAQHSGGICLLAMAK